MADAASSSSSIDLAQFQSRNCVILMFTPAIGDPRGIRQRMALKSQASGVIERDIVRVEVNGDEPSRRALRERFDVAADQFAVILISKDGVERLRRDEPVDANELFRLIDALPCDEAK